MYVTSATGTPRRPERRREGLLGAGLDAPDTEQLEADPRTPRPSTCWGRRRSSRLPAITWDTNLPPATGHYCFIATVNHPADPQPVDPSDPIDPAVAWSNFLSYIRNNNNVTWRNFDVVTAISGSQSAPQPNFIVAGAPDAGRIFDLELDPEATARSADCVGDAARAPHCARRSQAFRRGDDRRAEASRRRPPPGRGETSLAAGPAGEERTSRMSSRDRDRRCEAGSTEAGDPPALPRHRGRPGHLGHPRPRAAQGTAKRRTYRRTGRDRRSTRLAARSSTVSRYEPCRTRRGTTIRTVFAPAGSASVRERICRLFRRRRNAQLALRRSRSSTAIVRCVLGV